MLTCNHLNGVGVTLMKTLHVFNPRYTEKDVLMIDLDPEFPQVEWFIANALFYIYRKTEKIALEIRLRPILCRHLKPLQDPGFVMQI